MNDELSAYLTSEYEKNRNESPANIVDGLFAIARSLDRVAKAVRDLGNADAVTPMGAIELHGYTLKQGLGDIVEAIRMLKDEQDAQ